MVYEVINQSLASSILKVMPVSMLVLDQEGEILLTNPKTNQLFCYRSNELVSQHLCRLVPKRYHRTLRDRLKAYRHSPEQLSVGQGRGLPGLTKDGREVLLEIGILPFEQAGSQRILVLMIEADNPVINTSTSCDSLTGLLRRGAFMQMAEHMRSLAVRSAAPFGLIFLDLDGFKQVNDTLGHRFGDKVLAQVGKIIATRTRQSDAAARYGGDEFLVSYYNIPSVQEMSYIAKEIRHAVHTLPILADKVVSIDISIGGVWLSNADTLTIDEMIETADHLMYDAKTTGRGRVMTFAYL